MYLVSPDGGVKYSEIRTFMKKQPVAMTVYKSIKTSLNYTISLTGEHLIHARKSGTDKFNPM